MLKKLTWSLAAAAILAAGSLPASAATKNVNIPGRRYDPERVTIFVGDTVRWINTDDAKHTVTANSSAIARGENFDSSRNCGPGGLVLFEDCLERGDTFSHTFTTTGTFTYHCRRHGSDSAFADCAMCGQVIVKERKTTSPPTAPPTSSTGTPTSSLSPTTSGSPTVTPTGAVTSPGGARASGTSHDGDLPTIPVALAAVLVLGGSGFLVYRSLLRR